MTIRSFVWPNIKKMTEEYKVKPEYHQGEILKTPFGTELIVSYRSVGGYILSPLDEDLQEFVAPYELMNRYKRVTPKYVNLVKAFPNGKEVY